eukprot:TRINITY_DN1103_c0_g2_i2.p1 TRINITY_DN1103_c0_g2~~TRINITY_DN1103_c0_g2_i2.p1  ORF type:complete len:691 (+),score=251.86 TRINITY_DN1103_c0_g2_i2:77-2149(+)
MQRGSMTIAFAFLALLAVPAAGTVAASKHMASARPITAVVKQLKDMAEKSEADGEEEIRLYDKFECYCKKTLQNTSATMAILNDEIESLNNHIAGLAALGGEMAQKRAVTESDMKSNEEARKEAKAVRDESHEAFLVAEDDLVAALEQLNSALDTLSAVGNTEKYTPALVDVASIIAKVQPLQPKRFRGSFLQLSEKALSDGPGGVMGVLVSTRDTYVKNLKELRITEEHELNAYTKIKIQKTNAYNLMEAMVAQINAGIADTKENLGQKREQLAEAEDNLEKTRVFNEETDALYKEKTAIHEERAMLRAQEDAALAKAIAVLDSDEAFNTFGQTKTTGFLQLKSVHKHVAAADEAARRPVVMQLLETAAHSCHSSRLAGLAALVGIQNPFDKVLKEIDNMQRHISAEGKKDKEKKQWCEDERKTNNDNHKAASEQIITLTASIDELAAAIAEMTTTVATKTEELAANDQEQKTQTELRKSENLEYQKNIDILMQTQDLIARATKILNDYYDSIAKPESLLQVQASSHVKKPMSYEHAAPKTNDGTYHGQNKMGNTVIQLLDDIMADTKAEETTAHKDEQEAQISFEDSMQALTDQEKSLKEAITQTSADLAQAQLDSDNKKANLKETKDEKKSIEDYLADIKSDCDFIAANFDLREANRAAESTALAAAIDAIQGTPAYKKAEKAKSLE